MARVLIIENDALVARMFQIYLAGHEVLLAYRALSGLELLVSHSPDIVITEARLPDLNGLEALAAIRAMGNTPVIVLAGGGDWMEVGDYVDRAMRMGAAMALRKPVSREVLRLAVMGVVAPGEIG